MSLFYLFLENTMTSQETSPYIPIFLGELPTTAETNLDDQNWVLPTAADTKGLSWKGPVIFMQYLATSRCSNVAGFLVFNSLRKAMNHMESRRNDTIQDIKDRFMSK